MLSHSFKFFFLCSFGLLLSLKSQAQFGGGSAGGDAMSILQPEYARAYTRIGSTSQTQIIHDGSTVEFSNTAMTGTKLMYATITDIAGGGYLDTVKLQVSCFNTMLFNSTARLFVPRTYTITPTNDGSATITLYYTLNDFNTYNSYVSYCRLLPLNNLDVENYKSNLKVFKTSSNTDVPNLNIVSNPTVYWNNTDSFWCVTFTVQNSVSGNYYIGSDFLSNKMVSSISHISLSPSICQTSATATVDWNDVVGASDYRMRFRAQGNPNWNTSTTLPSQRNLSNLSFNTTYEVQIRVRESNSIQGEYSPTYSFTTPPPPLYPACITPIPSVINVGENNATLQWAPIQDATGYFIQFRLSGTATWGAITVGSASYTFTGLTPNTTYHYRVRTNCNLAYACSLNSSFSIIDSFTTSPSSLATCIIPASVQHLNVTASSATCTWASVNFAASYHFESRIKGTSTWGGRSTTLNTLQLNNLTPNTIYEYRVRTSCQPGLTSNLISNFSPINEFSTLPLSSSALFDQHNQIWTLFPNPVVDILHVHFYTDHEYPMQFQLFDITGRIVKSIVENPVKGNNQFEFNIQNLNQGIYMMKITQKNKVLHIQRIYKS